MKTLRKIFICIFCSAALLGAVVACLGAAVGLAVVMSCYSSERVQAVGIEKILPENEERLVKVHGWLELTERPPKTPWLSPVISKGTLGAYHVVASRNLSDVPLFNNVSLPSSSGEVWLMGRQRGGTLYVKHRFSGSHLAWHLCTHEWVILDWNYLSAGFFLAWALGCLLVALVALLLGWFFLTYAYPWAQGAPPAWLRLRLLALRLFILLPVFYVVSSVDLCMVFHYEWDKALLFFLISTLPLAAWLWSYRRNRIVNNSSK